VKRVIVSMGYAEIARSRGKKLPKESTREKYAV
jgi:hypothetical protein